MTGREVTARLHADVRGTGVPLVLIHGDLNNGASAWASQLESLAPWHRLIVPDRRGHGASPTEPRPYTIAGDAADLAALLDELGVERAHLVGHSYGGLVALEWAVRQPERCRCLHLIEPPYLTLLPDDPDVASIAAAGRAIFDNAAAAGGDRTAADFVTMMAGDEAMRRARMRPFWAAMAREAARMAHAEYPDRYPPARLDALAAGVPITVYTGARSHAALRKIASALAARRAGAHLVEFATAGHDVQRAGAPFDRALLRVTNPDAELPATT